MAMTTCRECRAEISSKARTCPKCGYDPKNSIWHKQFGCGSTLVLGFVLLVGYFMVTAANTSGTSSGGSTASSEPRFGSSEALYLCQSGIKSIVKDPEKTKVPFVREVTSGDDMMFSWGRGTSFVRTRNGFGNDVPASASCTVSISAQRITHLTFNGRVILDR